MTGCSAPMRAADAGESDVDAVGGQLCRGFPALRALLRFSTVASIFCLEFVDALADFAFRFFRRSFQPEIVDLRGNPSLRASQRSRNSFHSFSLFTDADSDSSADSRSRAALSSAAVRKSVSWGTVYMSRVAVLRAKSSFLAMLGMTILTGVIPLGKDDKI